MGTWAQRERETMGGEKAFPKEQKARMDRLAGGALRKLTSSSWFPSQSELCSAQHDYWVLFPNPENLTCCSMPHSQPPWKSTSLTSLCDGVGGLPSLSMSPIHILAVTTAASAVNSVAPTPKSATTWMMFDPRLMYLLLHTHLGSLTSSGSG